MLRNTSSHIPVHFDTSTFRRKNKTHFILNLIQNWTSLLQASKNNWKWLKNCYDQSAFDKRSPCVVQGLRVDKVITTEFWKVARIINVMFLRNSRNQYCVFKLKFLSLFISLCFFCVHYFSFALLTIIRIIKR